MICTEVTSGLRSGAKFMFFFNDMPTTCFFPQVKVQTWIDGTEDAEFVGVGARFGRRIVSKEKNANQTHVVFANPRDCCSPLKTKVYSCDLVISALCDAETEYLSFCQLIGDVVIVDRGNCRFTAKANNAEAAGASALLIINNQKGLLITCFHLY